MNKKKLFGQNSRFLKKNHILVWPLAAVVLMFLLLSPIGPVEQNEAPSTGIRILIADFTSDTDNSDLTVSLKPVLYLTLQLSDRLTVYPERKIRRYLKQNSKESLNNQSMVQQICLEEEIPMALLPTVKVLNGSLVISASIFHINENTKSLVDTIRVKNINHLGAAIEELSRRIRLHLGESRKSPAMSNNLFSHKTKFRTLKIFSQSLSSYTYRSRRDVMDGLNEILEENPDMAVAQLNLGMHYLQLQQRTKALPHIKKAKELSSDLPLKYRYLIDGIHNILLRRYIKAANHFQSYTQAFPSDWQAHFLFAQCASALGDYTLSIEEYQKAIAIDDTQIEPYIGLGMALLYNRDILEARRILDQASMLLSDNPDMEIAVGLLELVNNNPRFAIQSFEKAKQYPLYRSLGTFLQAQTRIYEGKFNEALKILISGIEEDQEYQNIDAETAKRLAMAQIYLTTGNISAAAAESRRITGSENDPVFMAQLGSVLAATGHMNAAENILLQLRASEAHPFIQAIAMYLQGEILSAGRRPQEAVQPFLLAKKLTNAPSISLARTLMDSGQWDLATEEFNDIRERKATLLFPFHKPWFMGSWVHSLFNAGLCNEISGNLTEAKQYFRQYLWVMASADSGLESLTRAEVLLTGSPLRRPGQNDGRQN